MPLTEEQKSLRALVFPGKRGKLDKKDQEIFAQLCAEKGIPLAPKDETSKPGRPRKSRRVTYKEKSSTEEDIDEEIDDESELEELEEVSDQEQQEDRQQAGARRSVNVKLEVGNEADTESGDEATPAAHRPGPAQAARQRQRLAGKKRGRPSTMNAAAQALMGLTDSLSPLPPAAAASKAAVGRQRIAAALPAAGFKPFAGAGASALRPRSWPGNAERQQYEAPYDYYEVYQSYLTCMDLYSRSVGRLGIDAVAAPIPPEELLGPAYACHLSTDQRAPHWVPQAAGTDTAAGAPASAGNKQAAAAAPDASAGLTPRNAATGRQTATAKRAEEPLPASITGRQQRRSAIGVAEAAAAAGKRPYRKRALAAVSADVAAAGSIEQHASDAADDAEQHKADDNSGSGHGEDENPAGAQPDGDMQAVGESERNAAANGNLSNSDAEMVEPAADPAGGASQIPTRGVTPESPLQVNPNSLNAAAGDSSGYLSDSSLEDGGAGGGRKYDSNDESDNDSDVN